MNYPNDLTTQLKNINIDKKFLNISQAGSGPYTQKEILINLLNKTNTNFNTFIWLFYEGNDHEDLIKNYGNNLNLEFKINSNISNQITDQTKVIYTPSNNIFILKYNKKKITDDYMNSVIIFVFAYLFIFILIAMLLSITGLDFLSAISGAATSISNVGPGLGEVIGPNGNFKSIPEISKWILSFGMLLGRLELFAVLILFFPSFWRN